MRQTLRPYQQQGIERVLAAWKRGARSVLLVLPTGGGKTTIFSEIAASVPSRVVILVHRRELAAQASNRLREFGVDHGFVLAGEPAKPYARVQIAGVQTLVRRDKAPPARLVIIDEAHLSTAESYRTILEQYPTALILGVTATPWRLSGKPLAGQYDACEVITTPAELCAQGFLAPVVGFGYRAPDLSAIDKVGDDYNQGQAGAAMSAIVPTIVDEWRKHAAHLSTVAFCATIEHSRKLTAEFTAAGVPAEHLDGSTSVEQRRAILARVDRGETRVLCNVGVAVEGLDIPRLKCCVLARPTMSTARALQMAGRVRRPWRDPKSGQWVTARIHDHAFVLAQHGLPDAERDYSIHAQKEGTGEKPLPSLSTCSKCAAIYLGRSCPECGVRREPTERELREVHDAEQFLFGAGTESVPVDSASTEPRALRTVEVAWDRASTGRTIEGVLESVSTRDTQWGPRKIYLIAGARYRHALPGTSHLDRLMARVAMGSTVRVTFDGEEIVGTHARKLFRVLVSRPEVTAPSAHEQTIANYMQGVK